MAVLRRLLLLLSALAVAFAHPNGAPCSQLENMTPQHKGGVFDRPSPYKIDLSAPCYKSGQIITVTLRPKSKDAGERFKGFIVQPRATCEDNVGQPKRVGEILKGNSENWKFQCEGDTTSITHSWNDLKDEIVFDWVPTEGFEGELKFVATVVKEYSTFWVQKITSRPLRKCDTPVALCGSNNIASSNTEARSSDANPTFQPAGASDRLTQ